MDIKCKWAGFMNKPGVVKLSVIDGQTVKIPLTVLTRIQTLTSSKWIIAGRSYDIFALPTQKKSQ